MKVLVALLVVAVVHADVYLHNPPGANNRLNGKKRNRKNDNRLMDSQNNQRGGYNVGESGDKEGEGTLSYVEGSRLSIQWTNQHECGGDNTHCDIILQYMCDQGLVDGTSTKSPKERGDNKDRGRHEDQQYYKDCKERSRDTNLYTADKDLENDDATSTRQNPEGGRSGLECPEERDYYPYHAPSPWRDIAILTNNLRRCEDVYQKQSQNVIPKGYCKGATTDNEKQPITETECNTEGGTWNLAPSHNLPAPECLAAPESRDNHLGNTGTPGDIPRTLAYDWKIPSATEGACVLRIRYNISTHDYEQFGVDKDQNNQNEDDDANEGGPSLAEKYEFDTTSQAEDRGYVIKNNPTIHPFGGALEEFDFQMAFNTNQTGRTFQDRTHKFFIQNKDAKNVPIHNLNVIGKRGNIVQVYPAVEYGFEPAVLTVNKGDYVHAHWTGSLNNDPNNDGQGKAGTDKSNIIAMTDRKWKLGGQEDLEDTIGLPGNSYPLNINEGTFLDVDKTMANKLALPQKTSSSSSSRSSRSSRSSSRRSRRSRRRRRNGKREVKTEYVNIGCYKDTSEERAIGDGTYQFYDYNTVLDQCYKLARDQQYTHFGIHNDNECHTARDAGETYNRHGTAQGCNDGKGGEGKVSVYKIMGEVDDQRPKVNEIKRTDAEKFWDDEDILNELEAELSEEPISSSGRERRSVDGSLLNNIVEDLHKVEAEIKNILQGSEGELDDEVLEGSEEKIEDEVLGAEEEMDDEVLGVREKRNGDNSELNKSPAKVDVGLIEAKECKTYNYMCTRNNNFSNRSQKGKVVVNCA